MNRKYHLFDAQGKVLGRLATQAAKILSGRDKVDYTPHIDGGDFVVVINSDKIRVTGQKDILKIYHRFSGYPGGITSISFADQMKKDSTKIIKSALYGMLPKNKLRKGMMKRLLVVKDNNHDYKIDITHD
jgi:large subunit ribosomal protein L13